MEPARTGAASAITDAARRWQRLGLRTVQRASAARWAAAVRERDHGEATESDNDSMTATLRRAAQTYRRRLLQTQSQVRSIDLPRTVQIATASRLLRFAHYNHFRSRRHDIVKATV